jgi:superfamily II DNA/RNA helicase
MWFVCRYGCEPYLLRNLKELGFKEPTPIQRQAIPILLSVWSSILAIFHFG